jgi:hypothetical protein
MLTFLHWGSMGASSETKYWRRVIPAPFAHGAFCCRTGCYLAAALGGSPGNEAGFRKLLSLRYRERFPAAPFASPENAVVVPCVVAVSNACKCTTISHRPAAKNATPAISAMNRRTTPRVPHGAQSYAPRTDRRIRTRDVEVFARETQGTAWRGARLNAVSGQTEPGRSTVVARSVLFALR